jgi:hypothetical protein
MWPFRKRNPESPQEVAAEERLDEATREAVWGELDKEAAREAGNPLAPLDRAGATQGPLRRDPDPGDEHGLRESLREDDEPG